MLVPLTLWWGQRGIQNKLEMEEPEEILCFRILPTSWIRNVSALRARRLPADKDLLRLRRFFGRLTDISAWLGSYFGSACSGPGQGPESAELQVEKVFRRYEKKIDEIVRWNAGSLQISSSSDSGS